MVTDANWVKAARRKTRLLLLFHSIDKNDSGSIEFEEVETALQNYGIKISRERLRELLERFDTDGDGSISYHEFCEVFNHSNLESIFDQIDSDHNGYLDKKEIRKVFSEYGLEIGKAQIESILSQLDVDADGLVSKEEFFKAFEDLPELDLESLGKELVSFSGVDVGSQLAPSLPLPNQPLLNFLIAGGAGGMSSKTVTAPLERVKIVAQTTKSKNSSITIARNIIQEEGWVGLFRGNTAGVLRVVPFASLVCFTYTILVDILPKEKEFDKYEPIWRFISGGIAGGFANCCTYPLDVIRARMAIQNQHNMSAVTKILLNEGPQAFFRGIGPTLLAVVPFIAIQQSSYDIIKKSMLQTHLPSVPLFLGCGITAGILAQTATHPLDVIRRQMQTSDTKIKISTKQAIKQLIANEGYRGLFRGILPATVKVAPAVAISLLVRDACLLRLRKN